MAQELKVGEVVELKSGSRKMTVNWATRSEVGVVWEDKDGVHKSATYNMDALVTVS